MTRLEPQLPRLRPRRHSARDDTAEQHSPRQITESRRFTLEVAGWPP